MKTIETAINVIGYIGPVVMALIEVVFVCTTLHRLEELEKKVDVIEKRLDKQWIAEEVSRRIVKKIKMQRKESE